MEHFDATVNGIRLHVAALGNGVPVVLLHGFPEFWYSWRSQLPALSEAGFRALAPDLRGHAQSERPQGVHQYRLDALVADVEQLIEHHAGGKAHVVGHDWGGIIAWRLAALRPEVVRKLAILNAPHPGAYQRMLTTHLTQWLRSSYVLGFQIPWIAEWLISAGDYWVIERAFRNQPSNPKAFTPHDIVRYKAALRSPGAVTCGLNYYRAALRYPGDLRRKPEAIDVPTLVIWGDRDPYLKKEVTEYLHDWVRDLKIEHLPDASHWVQNDAPDTVNRLLIDFFK